LEGREEAWEHANRPAAEYKGRSSSAARWNKSHIVLREIGMPICL
jgi:hypothetical protein